MVTIWGEFQLILRRRVSLMFIFPSRDFALFRGHLGTLARFVCSKFLNAHQRGGVDVASFAGSKRPAGTAPIEMSALQF